jgi:PIN domain nuclease of toxin-antitoxin system
MKLLLDTCTFLWIVSSPEKLSARALALYAAVDNDVYLSAASAWEIGVKHANGRLILDERPERFVPEQRDAHGIVPLPIDEGSALNGARLPLLHKDPFDRLLVGHAIMHGMTILTPDPLIAQYPAPVMW